jgi:hypothetical protein
LRRTMPRSVRGVEAFPVFQVAERGLPMAHGDVRMSDNIHLPAPSVAPSLRWHDAGPSGSGGGIGATSNGKIIACTYLGARGDNLVVYGARGERLWTSGDLLDAASPASVPLLDEEGGVIAADDRSVVRFGPGGDVRWNTSTPGGVCISPVITDSGIVVLATLGGPVSAFDSRDGQLVGSLRLPADSDGGQFFDTVNTPCVRGNRIYISAQLTDGREESPAHVGELIAVDVDPSGSEPLTVAWRFPFGSPSGGSPLRIGDTIYFDGNRDHPGQVPIQPELFAVKDDGTGPELLWKHPMRNLVVASAAEDPRGGLWTYAAGDSHLLRLDPDTGEELQDIDLDPLVDEPGVHVPASCMSIAETAERPVMLVAATAPLTEGSSWVTAIDLMDMTLVWKWKIADSLAVDWTSGQFPVVLDEAERPCVVFTTHQSGAYVVGAP